MSNIIFTQLKEHFKSLIEEIMLEERKRYLEENETIRANGYYTSAPKTILGEMELNIPRTRDGKFKTGLMPERRRITFMPDDSGYFHLLLINDKASSYRNRRLRYSTLIEGILK